MRLVGASKPRLTPRRGPLPSYHARQASSTTFRAIILRISVSLDYSSVYARLCRRPLFALLCAIVMILAQRLKWTRPEPNLVSTMRFDMVANLSLRDYLIHQTHLAERLNSELSLPDGLPARRAVPGAIRRRSAPPIVLSIVLLPRALVRRPEALWSGGHG